MQLRSRSADRLSPRSGARRSPKLPALAALALAALFSLCLCAALPPSLARADFGFKTAGVAFTEADGLPATQAGSHPYAWTTTLAFNTAGPPGEELPDGPLRDLRIALPAGLIGTPAALPRCRRLDFLNGACPAASAVGSLALRTPSGEYEAPLYNLLPSFGSAAELGFTVAGFPILVRIAIAPAPPYNLIVSILGTPNQALLGSLLTVRGASGESAFLTLPRSCTPPGPAIFEADSYLAPGSWAVAQAPTLPALSGCGRLSFTPALSASPTSPQAASPSGLDLALDLPRLGLLSPGALAEADLARAELTLPPQLSLNPAAADGLAACSVADLARETLASGPGEGCPQAAKIGTATASTPLLEEPVTGAIFLATPDDPATTAPGAENPFDARYALYLVFRDAARAVLVKQALEVQSDPQTGRLTALTPDIPQLPFEHFELHLNSGPRAPLSTPPRCGTYSIGYRLTPSSGARPQSGELSFATDRDCATQSFDPSFSAGTLNPVAGRASTFALELRSSAAEADVSGLSLTLPPGLAAALGSVPSCPEPATADATCPPASRLGYARLALGAGPEPLWVPTGPEPDSDVFLAGPYRGAPYSLLIRVPAQAGPFDLGTVVLRAPISISPLSAQATVRIEGLPQIVAGVPLKYRQIRLVIDRPGFIHNPTSCEPTALTGTAVAADGATAVLHDRFQAADCAALPLHPHIRLALHGASAANGHPGFSIDLRPRHTDANLRRASLTLPYGVFLDPTRLQTLCFAGELAATSCPPSARLGSLRIASPLLPAPEQGSVYLTESQRRLPDLAVNLGGRVPLDLHAQLSAPRGRLRASFTDLPDLPLTELQLSLAGARHGLFVNGTDLCHRRRLATAALTGQNGRRARLRLPLHTRCRHLTQVGPRPRHRR